MERPHSRVRLLWIGRALLTATVLAVLAFVAGRVVPARFFTVSTALVAAIWLVVGLLGLVHALLYYRSWRFEIQDDALYLVRGVVTEVETAVPYVRVQHVDTQRGQSNASSVCRVWSSTPPARAARTSPSPASRRSGRIDYANGCVTSPSRARGPTPYETAPPLSAVQRVIGTALQFGGAPASSSEYCCPARLDSLPSGSRSRSAARARSAAPSTASPDTCGSPTRRLATRSPSRRACSTARNGPSPGRIQNVDVSRSVFQRALGLAVVNFETAGGGSTEAVLDAVDLVEPDASRSSSQPTVAKRSTIATKTASENGESPPAADAVGPGRSGAVEAGGDGAAGDGVAGDAATDTATTQRRSPEEEALYRLDHADLLRLGAMTAKPGAPILVVVGTPIFGDLALAVLSATTAALGGPETVAFELLPTYSPTELAIVVAVTLIEFALATLVVSAVPHDDRVLRLPAQARRGRTALRAGLPQPVQWFDPRREDTDGVDNGDGADASARLRRPLRRDGGLRSGCERRPGVEHGHPHRRPSDRHSAGRIARRVRDTSGRATTATRAPAVRRQVRAPAARCRRRAPPRRPVPPRRRLVVRATGPPPSRTRRRPPHVEAPRSRDDRRRLRRPQRVLDPDDAGGPLLPRPDGHREPERVPALS